MKKYISLLFISYCLMAQTISIQNFTFATPNGYVTIPLTGTGKVTWDGTPDATSQLFWDQIQLNLSTPPANDASSQSDYKWMNIDIQTYGCPQTGDNEANAKRLMACIRVLSGK